MNDRRIGFYVVLIAVGFAALTAACGSSSDQPPLDTPANVAGAQEVPVEVGWQDGLRSSNRSDFVVCVGGAGGRILSSTDVEYVKLELEAALATVSDLPDSLRNPIVNDECPPAPPGIVKDMSPFEVIMPKSVVDTPSDEVLRVYLLPQAAYEAAFGTWRPYMIGSAEWFCGGGDSCSTVTTALYLNDVIDAELLRKVLLAGLGLERIEPVATPFEWDDLQACNRGETPTYFRCEDLEDYRQDLERALTPQPPDD